LLLLFSASAFAQNAVVRVNQLGYVNNASKRAYLMSKGAETGATFSLNSGGSSVFSAPIGADLGAWGTYLHVYALDFDSVSTAGSYTIAVTGPTAATSPGFKIDTGANIYATALAHTLSYYQNSRDGANFIASPLRTAAAHLNDQRAGVFHTPSFDSSDNITSGPTATGATIDASGGWFDAGDYVKFVETHSYTVAVLGVGVRDFPNQMGAGSSQSNFTAEVRFGLDWLQKMWDDNSRTLYYQVGLGTGNSTIVSDHDIWRLPQQDDTWGGSDATTRFIRNRPALINTAGGAGAKISPNMAGRLAADFAICYQIFKNSDPAYANQCLLSGEHVFDLANTAPSGNLLTVAPFDFYGESEWRDDLELGATELYLALQPGNLPAGLPHSDPNFYLTAAANWAHAYMTGPGDAGDTLNLYDVSGLAHYELYRALGLAGNPGGLAVNQTSVLADFNKELSNATTQGAKDPFGFGFPWNTDDTASHGSGLSVMASEHKALTGSNTQAAHAQRWLDNVLGANAWGLSFMVGDGTVFPDCIQHQIANLIGSLNGGSPVLSGAVVEGPNSKGTSGSLTGMKSCDQSARFTPFNGNGAVYVDNVQSFNTTEPAIDLTASSALAMAWQMAGSSTPTPDFTLGATPSSVTVTAGNNASYTATVTALNGFNGTVTFSASGLPSGATANFSPASVNGSGTSALAVTTSGSTPAGTYTLTITGTSGSVSHSTTVILAVTDFSLSATPGSQQVTAGSNASYTATVSAQNGFGGAVTFSVSGVPTGATASFNPTSVTGSGSSTLTVATGTAALGSYTLTITGTSGSLTHTASVTLTIAQQPTPDFTVSTTQSSQTVTVGGSTTYTVNIGALNSFNGSVALTLGGLPANATGVFNPTSVSTSGSSTLTVSTTSSTPTGSSTLTITGTSGSQTHSATVTLIVNAVSTAPVYQINSGGPAVSPFAADAFFSGGQTDTVTATINTSGVTNPAPMAVYQSERWGGDAASNPAPFSYTFTNLTAGASYTVRLHFAETFWTAAGQRKFNVAINGTQVLSNFDIIATAGAANKAMVQQFTTTANASGNVVVSFTVGTADAPKISGIEIIPAAPPAPDFTLGVGPTPQIITVGASASYTATISALNGFVGTVSFTTSGLPSGATPTFAPTSVTGSGTSTLTVATDNTVAPATYPFTVTATGGTLTHTANVTLIVNPQPVPDFTLSATPTTATVTSGNSTSYTINVGSLNGFSGNVGLTVSGVPTGATASFNPTSVAGSGSAMLTVASGTAAANSYTLTITGTSGSTTHSSTVTLVINPVQSQCLTSGTTWQNTPLPTAQTGTFTVTWDATPSGSSATSPINSVIALSNGAQMAYTGFATLVAFNSSGIQARKGGSYTADSPIPYTAGVMYHFREVVNVPAHTYSVFVTAPGGAEQSVATDYAFRSEQSAVTQLNNWGIFASAGSVQVCNFTLVPPTPDFSVSATQGTVTVTAGANASDTINIGALNGFSGNVTLSASGVPSGATASFNPASVAGSGSSMLTIATGTAAPATYALTISGSSDGGVTHTAAISLVINPQPVPDFTISATPGSQTVTIGNSTSYTINVAAVNGFSGSVGLSVSGVPAGATSSFKPTSVSGLGGSTLTISTGTAATGTYTLTITGTSTTSTHTAMVTLIINAVSTAPVYQVNSGGAAVTPFAADAFFSGGQTDTVTATINTSGVTNPAPMAVYQSERWGGDAASNPAPFSYTFTNLTPGASYNVRLHFAEIFWTAAGQRKFNVAINGTQVLTNFDIIAAAGAANKAIVQQFTTTANTSGNIVVSFTVGTADAPKISGIEIIPLAAATPDFSLAASPGSVTVAPGGNATYTATVSALNGFSGSVAFSVSGVPTGATASFNPASVSGSGSSTLTVTAGTAAAGTYNLTITGTSGSLSHSAPVTFTISAPGAARFFAPYVDMSISPTNNLPQTSSASGIKFFTMAFIIDGGGCTPVWGGLGPISSENTFTGYISTIRSAGGDVVVSFGGAAGTELAMACSSVSSLQAAYQSVINKYNVKMLDFDIEGTAEGDQASLDRRSQALANLATANPGLVISLTLPVNPTGLDSQGLNVVNSFVHFNVPVSVVTIMAMDYSGADTHMGSDATMAATDTISQLQTAGLNANVGIIPMIGQNDTAGEIFTLSDAQTVLSFAQSNNKITRLSFWSVPRDNGGCAGNTQASDTCSGISQSTWAFSRAFEPFQ
jgi:endoglucanase